LSYTCLLNLIPLITLLYKGKKLNKFIYVWWLKQKKTHCYLYLPFIGTHFSISKLHILGLNIFLVKLDIGKVDQKYANSFFISTL